MNSKDTVTVEQQIINNFLRTMVRVNGSETDFHMAAKLLTKQLSWYINNHGSSSLSGENSALQSARLLIQGFVNQIKQGSVGNTVGYNEFKKWIDENPLSGERVEGQGEGISALQIIPDMTHPYGKHWKQPKRDDILITEKEAKMSEEDFKKLADYSHSQPTGAYEGKMWKTSAAEGGYYLAWFGVGKTESTVSTNFRKITILSATIKKSIPENLCDHCKDPYDHHDGGKVNCHPQYINGYNDAYQECLKKHGIVEEGHIPEK